MKAKEKVQLPALIAECRRYRTGGEGGDGRSSAARLLNAYHGSGRCILCHFMRDHLGSDSQATLPTVSLLHQFSIVDPDAKPDRAVGATCGFGRGRSGASSAEFLPLVVRRICVGTAPLSEEHSE